MRRPLVLTSADNPRIKQVIHLRKHRDRRQTGLFVAEGTREVIRAAHAGLKLREIFLCPPVAKISFDDLADQLPRSAESASLFEITPPLLSKISLLDNPEGLLATVETPTFDLSRLPPPSDTDLFLVAAGVNKPGNLGAMARTAAAAGATALLADADIDAFNPNAIRASTGAVFSLPILADTADRFIQLLRSRHTRIVSATPEAKEPYTDADLTGAVAIVIGAEDQGVPPEWRAAAVQHVSIPMATSLVDSLNASNTAAILAFEVLRQRRAAGRRP